MSSDVVVWEWEDTWNLWLPYDVKVCKFIESHYMSSPNISRINLGQVDRNLRFYDVNLSRLVQIRLETGRERSIRRQLYSASWPPGQGIMWQWWNDVTWVSYDVPSCYKLEKGFQSKQVIIYLFISSLNLSIAVDISDENLMIQVNRETSVKREVRRINCPPYPLSPVPSNSVQVQSYGNHSMNAKTSTAKSFGSSSNNQTKNHCLQKEVSKLHNNKASGNTIKDQASSTLSAFCSDVDVPPDEECSICFENLNDESGFGSGSKASSPKVRRLIKCDHMFHNSCLLSMYQSGNKDGSLQCPTCKTIHGVKKGIQPDTGAMTVQVSHDSLPGYPNCGMFCIIYDFRPGVQGPEHPDPGKRFTVRGFPRACYIPDNVKGRKVLRLLKIAWDRRIIFTIGSSSTTGEHGTVVWNEIHHKTEPFSNHSGHGYPDPNYLDNVLAELAAHGVTEEEA